VTAAPAPGRARPESLLADSVALPSTTAAAGIARSFLARALRLEPADVVDTAALLTTELVANAVLHGGDPVRLQLRRHAGRLRVEVLDGGQPFPVPTGTVWSLTHEGGRGLLLVQALASSWGCESNGPAPAGKTLWFELACDEPDAPAVAG
jgi:anti-sigma regulatory factor (Ser/Thr protein kinase)